MSVRKTRYVAACTVDEAWLRMRARLDHDSREEAAEDAEIRTHRDACTPKCKYIVWELQTDIHVDEGPESDPDDEWGYDNWGKVIDLR